MNWQLQRLRQSSTDKMLVGVCGGLGESTPVPAVVWRWAFVIATLFGGGTGLLVYVLMWWLMPSPHSTGAPASSEWNLPALRLSASDAQFAGVCGGLAEYTPVPAWLWRVAFVSLVFAGGIGLLAYVLIWLFVPRAHTPVYTA